VILLFSLLFIEADLYLFPSLIFSQKTFHKPELSIRFPFAAMTITFSFSKIFLVGLVSRLLFSSSMVAHHHVSAAQLTKKTLSGC